MRCGLLSAVQLGDDGPEGGAGLLVAGLGLFEGRCLSGMEFVAEVGVVGHGAVADECLEDLSGNGTFQCPVGRGHGPAFRDAAVAEGFGDRVVCDAVVDDVMQGGVGLSVAPAAEAVTVGAARVDRDGRGTTQRSEGVMSHKTPTPTCKFTRTSGPSRKRVIHRLTFALENQSHEVYGSDEMRPCIRRQH